MTLKEKFEKQETLNAILTHLNDPLKPNTKEWEEIQEFVTNPLKNPLETGGLTPLGHSLAEETDNKKLLQASQNHTEKTRIHVHCVLKACQLYTKLHTKGELNELEEKALKKGIALELPNGKTEFILTVVKGGELLAKPLTRMMEKLYKALKTQKSEFYKVLQHAASLHQQKSPQPNHLPAHK
jgi:hypothetical protein